MSIPSLLGEGSPDPVLESEPNGPAHRFVRDSGVEGTTATFEVHLQMCDAMPDIDAPFTDPDNAEIPSEPAMAYALCASLAYRVKKSTSANLVRFINRIPAQEYSAFAMKTVVNLNGKAEIRKWAHDVKEVRDWLTGDAKLLVLEEKAS